MAVYQPYQGYLTAYESAVQNVMKTIYDPVVIPLVLRAGEVTKYFKPTPVAFPKGKALVIRAETVPSQTARFFGPPIRAESSDVGPLLPNPAQSPEWAYWSVDHTDMMGLAAGVRYAFPTERVWDENDVAGVAQMLSRESAEDIAEAQERALVGRQDGSIAKVMAVTNSTAAYAAGSVNWSLGNTTGRLWLNTSGILFHQGAVIDIVHKDLTYESSLRGITVKGAGMENPASGVYGYIDVDSTTRAAGSTAASLDQLCDAITAASPAPFVYMSGEYLSTSCVPDGAPSDPGTSGVFASPYGLQDWFKKLTGEAGRAVGTIYNINRATLGNQWTLPIVVDKYSSGDQVITMEYLDALLVQLFHKRLDQDGLTNYVILAGPLMVEKLIKLQAVPNRRVDGAVAAQQSIMTNYNFDGIMIHHPSLGTPVAVQQVRGLPENMIFVIQPGVCEMLNLGPPQWFPWSSSGDTWHNEQYTSGAQGGLSRTLMQRADRIYACNSMIRAPLWNGALLGIKPA